MREGVSLIDGHSVGDTITRVEHDTSGTSGGIQREYGLDGDVHGWSVEGLEHDLCHLLPVGLGVEGSLSQQNRVLLWGNTKFVVEGVMPDLKIKRKKNKEMLIKFLAKISLCTISKIAF